MWSILHMRVASLVAGVASRTEAKSLKMEKKFQKSKTYIYQRFLSADNCNKEMTINLEILSQRTFWMLVWNH